MRAHLVGVARLAVILAAGLGVAGFLTVGASAQPNVQYPGAAATATLTPRATASADAQIMGGRGRAANIRANSFTILWTSDAETTGTVLFGTTAALGSSASDVRGAGFIGRTHYVDVTGLQPATIYLFDVQTGGTVDNNGGQHYALRTGPEIGPPPVANGIVGEVLNPGGGSPAAGALVWGSLRDTNQQGTGGVSQLLAALAGPDGRFRLDLNVRVPDLTAYFIYTNAGDIADLTARAPTGEVTGAFDTSISEAGTAPGSVRLVLVQGAQQQPGYPGPATAVPTPTATRPPAVPTAVVAQPTAAPVAPAVQPTTVPLPVAPVQLPTLREMLLNQIGVATPAVAPPAGVGYPGAVVPAVQPAAATPPSRPPPVVVQPTPAAVQPAPQVVVAQPTAAAPGSAVQVTGAARTVPGTQPAPAVVGTPFAVGSQASTSPLPVPTPQPSGLAAMPPLVSLLLNAGLALVVIGCGIAVYSLVSGPDWRPR